MPTYIWEFFRGEQCISCHTRRLSVFFAALDGLAVVRFLYATAGVTNVYHFVFNDKFERCGLHKTLLTTKHDETNFFIVLTISCRYLALYNYVTEEGQIIDQNV